MSAVVRIAVPDLGCISCAVPADVSLSVGDRCVCEHDHVHEAGVVRAAVAAERVTGTVLRRASAEDLEREATNRDVASKALATFRQQVTEHHMAVRPTKARFSLRRERLILWCVTEQSIDLRQVVGQLQRQFSTKVDARVLSARGEAALLGGCGICGRPFCCATWLSVPPSVTMRMAHAQDLSPTPGAVNGICGKLKCCLRYEHAQYREAAAAMPPCGVIVSWNGGEGLVQSRDILGRKITVRTDDGRHRVLPLADLHPSRHAPSVPAAEPGDEEGPDHAANPDDTDH